VSRFTPTQTTPTEQARAEEARRIAAESAQAREALDVQEIAATAPGRRLLRLILARSGVVRPSFDTNAMAMAFNEGRRAFGLELVRLIEKHCTGLLAQLLDDRTSEARPST
jgi:hypothetical protein